MWICELWSKVSTPADVCVSMHHNSLLLSLTIFALIVSPRGFFHFYSFGSLVDIIVHLGIPLAFTMSPFSSLGLPLPRVSFTPLTCLHRTTLIRRFLVACQGAHFRCGLGTILHEMLSDGFAMFVRLQRNSLMSVRLNSMHQLSVPKNMNFVVHFVYLPSSNGDGTLSKSRVAGRPQ